MKRFILPLLLAASSGFAADPTFSAIRITGSAQLPAATSFGGTAVGTAATRNVGTGTGNVPSNADGSGIQGLTKSQVGLANVDNTSDANKPVSSAAQTALDAKLDDSQATAFTLTLLDDANAAAARLTLGLGDSAILNTGTAASTVMAGNDIRVTTSEFKRTIFPGGDGVHWYRIPSIRHITTGSFAGRTVFACEDRSSPADYLGTTSVAIRYSDDRGKTLSAIVNPPALTYSGTYIWMNPIFLGSFPSNPNREWMAATRVHKNDDLTNLAGGTSTDVMRQYYFYSDDGFQTVSTPVEITSFSGTANPIQKFGTGVGVYSSADDTILVGRWTQALGAASTARMCGVAKFTGTSWTYVEAGTGYESTLAVPTSNYVIQNARQALSTPHTRRVYTSTNNAATFSGRDDFELPDPSNSASLLWMTGTNYRLVFVNTANPNGRTNFTIRHSKSNPAGTGWSPGRTFDAIGGNGYSSMAQIDDRLVAVLYEGSAPGTSISFAILDATSEEATMPPGKPIIADGGGSEVVVLPLQNINGPITYELWSGTDPAKGKLIVKNSGTGSGVTMNATGSMSVTFQSNGTNTFGIAQDGKLTAPTATGTTSTSVSNVATLDGRYGTTLVSARASSISVTSSTTLVDALTTAFSDTQLWEVHVVAYGTCSSTGGIKIALAADGVGGANIIGAARLTRRDTGAQVDHDVSDNELTGTGFTSWIYESTTYVSTGGSSGSIRLKFAQVVSDGTATLMGTNSWMTAKRLQ